MGNQQSVQTHIDLVDLSTNYTYEMKYTDNRFGEIKMLKRRETGERIFQKDYSTNSAKEFEDCIQHIKKRIPLLHPNLLKILGYNSKKEDLFCADFYKIALFFESFETDLEKEIYKRNTNKNYFTETELRCLLDSVISAASYLQKNNLAQGDIRPFNIFITKNREYKICDNHLFQNQYNPAHFNLLDGLEAKSHYPSPQVFKHYKEQYGRTSDFDVYKNDVFGLGMSVIMAAQLEKIDQAYDYDNKIVKHDVINEALDKLKDRYSEGFVEALRVLVSAEEVDRPNFIELDDEIKAYRSDIRARAHLERTLEAQKKSSVPYQQQERTVRAANPSQTPGNPLLVDNDLDNRVRSAVQRSETMINRSPSKFKNDVLDSYIHSYLKKDDIVQDRPLLYNIAPQLTMQSKLVPTLKVYSQQNPNLYGSQYNVSEVGNHIFASGGSPPSQINFSAEKYSTEGLNRPAATNDNLYGGIGAQQQREAVLKSQPQQPQSQTVLPPSQDYNYNYTYNYGGGSFDPNLNIDQNALKKSYTNGSKINMQAFDPVFTTTVNFNQSNVSGSRNNLPNSDRYEITGGDRRLSNLSGAGGIPQTNYYQPSYQ